jgi:hypothetical protein
MVSNLHCIILLLSFTYNMCVTMSIQLYSHVLRQVTWIFIYKSLHNFYYKFLLYVRQTIFLKMKQHKASKEGSLT